MLGDDAMENPNSYRGQEPHSPEDASHWWKSLSITTGLAKLRSVSATESTGEIRTVGIPTKFRIPAMIHFAGGT
jgi:hypothetical protein